MPVTATTGCLDGNHVSFLHLPADLRWQLLAAQEVAADPARFAAAGSARPVAPAVGEQGEAGGFEDSHGAYDAVAAPVLAVPARAVEQLVALDAHRILRLEGLDRGVECIAHADVDARGSRPLLARPLAAADGLVVCPIRTANNQVVHRPLALRRKHCRAREGRENGVRYAAARLDVPGHDGRGAPRVHQAAIGGIYVERGVGAGVGRHVTGKQYAQGEVAGRARHGERAVHVAAYGVRGPGEIDAHRVFTYNDLHPDRDVFVYRSIALHKILRRVLAVGQVADDLAGTALGVGDDLAEGREHRILAAAFHKLPDALFGDLVRRYLRPEVAAPYGRRADVGEQEVEHVDDVLAAPHQTDRRDDYAFLEDLPRVARRGTGTHPAHVRVMGPGYGVTDDLTIRSDGGDDRYVRQVRPAGVRVVDGKYVARLWVAAHYGRDRLRHRAEVYGDMLCLGDHPSLCVEERRRAVAPLLYVRRVGAPNEDRTHLLGDADQSTGQDRKGYGVEPSHRPTPARACLHHQPRPATLA